jgi:hypothetical protein
MTDRIFAACSFALTLALAAGCGGASSPASPSGTTGEPTALDALMGAWKSSSSPAGTTAGGCSQLEYEVAKAPDGRSGTVQFKGTCAGITASGTGRGQTDGNVLTWSAEGTASRGGVSCAFAFTNSTATREGQGVRLNYSGTVCGLPVSGSELLSR